MCAIHIPQNFYRQTISQDVPVGTGNIYVSVKPTVSEGYMTISPASSTLREIVYFSATGTDSTGDYITISNASDRGIGGTTEQTHIIGEPVRMNVGAETIQEISDSIDQVVAAGAQDASTSTKGIVKLSAAPTSATEPIALGTNSITIETTTGVTHSLTTVANEKVIVWAKGSMNGVMAGTTGEVKLNYNSVQKDVVQCYAYTDNKVIPFSLMYTETPGAATHDITVTGSTPTNVVIIVQKIKI